MVFKKFNHHQYSTPTMDTMFLTIIRLESIVCTSPQFKSLPESKTDIDDR